MRDFEAASIAPAFWKLRAFPDHPVVITRLHPDGPLEVARFDVNVEAEIVPSLENIGRGLFTATRHYRVASGEIREATDYYLVFGLFSILTLKPPLGAAIEGALR